MAETIVQTKNYGAMLEYLGGFEAFELLVSIPTAPGSVLTIDQLMARINVGRLLPEHRQSKDVVDLLTADTVKKPHPCAFPPTS
jgi:hypothetical protein